MFQRLHASLSALSGAIFSTAVLALTLFPSGCHTASSTAARPLRALLITGGCCHNYKFQSEALTNALGRLAVVEWTIVQEGGTGTKAMLSLYDHPDWAKG